MLWRVAGMANPVIAKITCPHCGNDEATVHQENKKAGKKYYRCYGGPDGDCGTVQIRYEGGQKFINKNMRPLEPVEQDQEVEAAAEEAKAEAAEQVRKVRREKKPEPEPKPETKKPAGVGGIVKGMMNLLGDEE